jgi:hypothetical protein
MLKITLHTVLVPLLSPYHISCQDISPCSQAHSSPFYRGCCSLDPPSHVHRHTVLSLGHMNYCSDTHRHCRSPCHSVLVDIVSHTVLRPTLAYTDMLQSQGHSQCCCRHGSYTQGCTPVQTTLTHTSFRTTRPCSLVDTCMSLQTEHRHQYTSKWTPVRKAVLMQQEWMESGQLRTQFARNTGLSVLLKSKKNFLWDVRF